MVPVDDGGVPAGQSAAQAAQCGQAVGVGEVGGVALGELGAVDVVEPAEGFFGVPRQADFAVGIAGL